MKPIAIGADDAAVELKAQIVKHLESKGILVHDYRVSSDDPMPISAAVSLSVSLVCASSLAEIGNG